MWMLALLACTSAPGPGTTGTTTTASLEVGLPHRPDAVVCDSVTPAEPTCGPIDGYSTTCKEHADCGSGFCAEDAYGCYCRYDECDADEDCGNGACVCGSAGLAPVDTCQPAECRVDADCGTGLCLATRFSCGGPDEAVWSAWKCATEQDTCRSDEVCTGENELCVYEDERFQCSSTGYVAFCDSF